MTTKDFLILTLNALSDREEILHIFESKQTFKHDSLAESLLNEYKMTYTKEKVAQELLNMVTKYPSFFLYFIIFTKLKEMDIIDSGLYYHILNMIVHYQHEFDDFIVGLPSRYRLDE